MFVGTVIDIENPADERRGADQRGLSRYRFRVDENINGVGAKELDVYSGRGGGDCSFHFQLGEQYFVDPYESEGRLFATICSDTQRAANVQVLLEQLRARRDSRPFASVYGVLRRTQQPYGRTEQEGYDRPLPNVAVELRSEGQTLSARTDENGVYRFYEVPAGTYHFWASPPPDLELAQTILSDPPPPITLPDHACYQQDLEALPTGRIRGRVIGTDGKPLKSASVELFRPDLYNESDMGWWEFQGEDKDYFEFEHVAPGKYLLVFNNSNRLDTNAPFPRTFYPGVPDRKSALTVNVSEGQHIETADIHVSGGRPTRQLTVRVQWADGTTPDDVYLSIAASEGDEPFAEKVSPGVFEVAVLRGAQYTVYAWQDCGLRWEGDTGTPIGKRQTGSVRVDGSDDRTPEIKVALNDPSCKPYH